MAIGFDVQRQQFSLPSENEETNRVSVAPLVDLRLALGYNSERFFAGITFADDLTSVHFPKLAIAHQYIRFDIKVGFRLNPPNFMREKAEKQ